MKTLFLCSDNFDNKAKALLLNLYMYNIDIYRYIPTTTFVLTIKHKIPFFPLQ